MRDRQASYRLRDDPFDGCSRNRYHRYFCETWLRNFTTWSFLFSPLVLDSQENGIFSRYFLSLSWWELRCNGNRRGIFPPLTVSWCGIDACFFKKPEVLLKGWSYTDHYYFGFLHKKAVLFFTDLLQGGVAQDMGHKAGVDVAPPSDKRATMLQVYYHATSVLSGL